MAEQSTTRSARPLSYLAGKSFVSQAALASILDSVRNNPDVLNCGTSRSSVKRKRDDFLDAATPFGNLLQFMDVVMTDGTTKQIGFVHPLAFLWWMLSQSKHFAQFFYNWLKASGAQPWHGIIYADEVTPGNVLRRKNNRKTWTMYMAFRESPDFALVCQIVCCWFNGMKSAKKPLNT